MAYKTDAELWDTSSIDCDDDHTLQLIDLLPSPDVDGETMMLLNEAIAAGFDSVEAYLAA